LPQLGESVTEGTLERWFVKPGDVVNKYDPLAEVITDKVNAEVPSSFSGTVEQLLVEEGTTVAVGTSVCTIRTAAATAEIPIVANAPEQKSPPTLIVSNVSSNRYSPVVGRLAMEHNIDLERLQGTGLEGRITRKDVLQAIEMGNITKVESVAHQAIETKPTAPSHEIDIQLEELTQTNSGDFEVPVSNIRKNIAQNMSRSKHEIPHAWMMIEVDVTELVTYRNNVKDEFYERERFPLTYFAFFVKVVAQALKEFPIINSTWTDNKIIVRKDINLSIAVGVDDELYVPVIKHADEKTIKGIAREIYELSTLAREKKLKLEHISGGTFTVNNTGSFGSLASFGIINHPQAAIIQVESIVKKPVIIGENMFAARDMVNICMSLDHRILDGLICGKFLKRVKYLLENTNNNSMSVY
jgi:2-oxoisovalerate dehydrogenase E2 component (dihydrolipoyl transacylase)